MKSNTFYIYILLTNRDTLYIGYTNDLSSRLLKHLTGEGAKYTRTFKPVRLMQAWSVSENKGLAMSIEAVLKKKSRKDKEKLIFLPKILEDNYIDDGVKSIKKSLLDEINNSIFKI